MDSRAKERLTGAVILVALFVLLVPELLTGPSSSQPAPPADESGLRRYTFDVDAPQSSVQPAAPAPPPEVKLPEIAQQPAGDTARAIPGEAAMTASTPIPAPTPTPAPAPAPREDAAPAAPLASTQPARTPPAATPAPAPAGPASRDQSARNDAPRAGAFVVQLGTFENRENADRLVRDMTAKGFAAFVAPFKTSGRELYRVRVGPARDRAAAEALAAQLKRAGQSGSVVSIS